MLITVTLLPFLFFFLLLLVSAYYSITKPLAIAGLSVSGPPPTLKM